SVKEIG
ncbi:hypothetical protein DSL65_01330, partial [Metamycoplasma hominis]